MMGLKVGLLVVGLLAMVATPPAMAQFSDPLTLATSGVLIPFFGSGNNISLLEVASPVTDNPLLHFIFYNAFCTRVESFPTVQTTNDIDLYAAAANDPAFIVVNTDGLAAIASDAGNGIDLIPLVDSNGNPAPIHTRMYWINVSTNKFRVLEPIILDTFELPSAISTWVPIRTGATFFAPQEDAVGLQTTLYLICPRDTIQGATGSAFPTSRFPIPQAPSTASTFKSSYPSGSLRARVYDGDEVFLRDWQTDCNCLQTKVLSGTGAVSSVYVTSDTYTEMETDGTYAGFTGYKSLAFAPASQVDFFGRLSNANRLSLQGFFPGSAGGCGNNCR
jgi:hypothetical protein